MERQTRAYGKELFTIAEIAAMLSCCERLVEKLIARRELESSIMPGTRRARRVSRAQLERYLAKFNGA
jgi:excisionase family DNA binding protein